MGAGGFLSRHVFSLRHDYRTIWSRFVHALESGQPDDLPGRAALAVARTIGASKAVLWRYENGRFGVLARHGFQEEEAGGGVGPDLALVLEAADGPVEIDAPILEGRLPSWLPRPPDGWLLVPLLRRDALFGLLLLGPPPDLRRFDREDRQLLEVMGRAVASYIAEDEAVRRLGEAKEFEAFNRRFAYVMHDVKNLAGQLSLTLANARRHRGDPAFYEDMLETLEASIARINRLIAQMRHGHRLAARSTDLGAFLKRLARARQGAKPGLVEPLPPLVARIDEAGIESAIGQLIDNGFEAGGRVRIRLYEANGMAVIAVEDNGPGIPPFVRERLFRPFSTTKPGGMGLGLAQARDIVERSGGRIEIESAEGRGTTARIRLPMAREMAA